MTQKRKKNKEKTKKKSATVTKKEGRYIGYCVLDWGKKVKEKGEGYLYLGFLLRPHNFCLLLLYFFFPSTTLLCIATAPASSFAKYPFIACYAERGIGLISIGFICVP
jgi:hypothetical protein